MSLVLGLIEIGADTLELIGIGANSCRAHWDRSGSSGGSDCADHHDSLHCQEDALRGRR